jgi:hypothetical protein
MQIIYKRVQRFWDVHKYINIRKSFVRFPCTKTLYLHYNLNLILILWFVLLLTHPSLNWSSLGNISWYNNFSNTHNMPSWTFNIFRNNVMTRNNYLNFFNHMNEAMNWTSNFDVQWQPNILGFQRFNMKQQWHDAREWWCLECIRMWRKWDYDEEPSLVNSPLSDLSVG